MNHHHTQQQQQQKAGEQQLSEPEDMEMEGKWWSWERWTDTLFHNLTAAREMHNVLCVHDVLSFTVNTKARS